jgi:hypothetical protein
MAAKVRNRVRNVSYGDYGRIKLGTLFGTDAGDSYSESVCGWRHECWVRAMFCVGKSCEGARER